MSNDHEDYQFRNCAFTFKCGADWNKLDGTSTENIRFCNICQKQVHRCDTDDELLFAIKSNLCIAINPPFQKSNESLVWIGSMRVVKHDQNSDETKNGE